MGIVGARMSWFGEPGRHALARRGIKTTGSLANKIVLRRLAERADTGRSLELLNVGDPPFQIPEQGKYHRSPIEDSPIRKIPIKEIWTWQEWFNPEVVEWKTRPTSDFIRGLTPIEAIYDDTNNQYWIYDGSHRVIAAKLLGRQTIEAKVLTVSGIRSTRPDTTMSHPKLGPI